MKISDPVEKDVEKLRLLIDWGLLGPEELRAAAEAAAWRNVDIERILRYQYGFTRRRLLEALSGFYQCPWVEYDERVPVPIELLSGIEPGELCASRWFPYAKNEDVILVAAADPCDPSQRSRIESLFPDLKIEMKVALSEDISSFIQDFLNNEPAHIVGNERTGLAYWRNTMARWRTRLACYRTDFAIARTHLGSLRWGLGLIAFGRTLLNIHKHSHLVPLYWAMIVAGFLLIAIGIVIYFRLKQSVVSPPNHHTLVEVTAATLYFLEDYQFVEKKMENSTRKQTMLSRLSHLLPDSCVFIDPSRDNKVRSYLAHERTALAAERTVFGCYRTIYARARTGLSFIRTGVSFSSIGLGLFEYFGRSSLNLLDCFIVFAGILMILDGIVWYWPIRKEQREAPVYAS